MNRNEYKNAWRDSKYKRFELVVPKKEEEVIEKLESVENRSAYIVELVQEDLKKEA